MRLPPGAGDKPSGEAPGSLATIGRGWLAAIFAASAVYAGAVALFSGIGVHRQWAIIAAPAYVLAAVAAAAWKRRGLDLSLLLGFAGGLVVPLTWMAIHGESQREIKVIIRSAWSLIHHGTLPELSYRAAVQAFGEHGAAELIYLVGLYCLVSVTLNGFNVPVPESEAE